MSTLDEAREALDVAEAYLKKDWANDVKFPLVFGCIIQAVRTLSADPATPATETGEGEDATVREMREAFEMSSGNGGWVVKNRALRHGWERIADLERRLADERRAADKRELAALRERDEARTSLEAMERRVGELEGALRAVYTRRFSPFPVEIREIIEAALPDAGEGK